MLFQLDDFKFCSKFHNHSSMEKPPFFSFLKDVITVGLCVDMMRSNANAWFLLVFEKITDYNWGLNGVLVVSL